MSFVPFSGNGQRLGDPHSPDLDMANWILNQAVDIEMLPGQLSPGMEVEYDTLQDIKTMVASWDVEIQDHEYTRDIKEGVQALAMDVVMAMSAIQESCKADTRVPTKDEVHDLCKRFDDMKPLVQDLIKNTPPLPDAQAGPCWSCAPATPSVPNPFETPEGKKKKKRRAPGPGPS